MDVKLIIDAIAAVSKEKGISEEVIKEAVKDAIRKGFIKKINGDEDALVEITIDEEKGKIIGTHTRYVVPNDYGTDYIDIRLEEALQIKKDAKIDGEIVQKYDLTKDDAIGRSMALTIKSFLNQKIAEAEKNVLFERFSDKKGEMITGTVERCDNLGCTVKLSNGPSLTVSRKDLIGDEMFQVGDLIRLYVNDVSQTGKGSQIKVTRACEGFLKRIFEEEIHEVYDGTVIIKGIARLAGIRSKISVFTKDENVDAIGAIIGPQGSRIQRVVKQLGGSKEKIDVFLYNESAGLHIIEALKPAIVKGLYFRPTENGSRKVVAVVDDGQSSLAIGKKFSNIRLASKITGYEIEIMEESVAAEQNIPLTTPEEFKAREEERIRQEKYENYLRQVKASKPVVSEHVTETTTGTTVEKEDVVETPVLGTVSESAPIEETKVEETKVEEPVEEVKTVKVEVTTTSTLDELEKSLEDSKSKSKSNDKFVKSKRPKKITDEEVGIEKSESTQIPPEAKKQGMAIYTEEELAELEKEELEDYEDLDEEEEIDYDEYDKYYDDEQ